MAEEGVLKGGEPPKKGGTKSPELRRGKGPKKAAAKNATKKKAAKKKA